MNSNKLWMIGLVAIGLLSAFSASAIADESNTFNGATISIAWGESGPSGNSWNLNVPGNTDGSPDSHPADGSYNGSGLLFEWADVYFNADPIIAGNFAVTNNSPVPQTFSLNVIMPTAFATGGSTTHDGGSAITVSDANFSGGSSLSTFAGFSIYASKVNGSVSHTLFDSPYSLTTPPGTTNAAFLNFGPLAGPGVALITSIGIDHTFTLSPGDRATVNSNYRIVPEPATLSLFVIGTVVMLRRRAR